MKTFKQLQEEFGRAALAKKAKEKGFGTPEHEKKLVDQKAEMEARHAKADAEMAERDRAWKAKYGKKKEGE